MSKAGNLSSVKGHSTGVYIGLHSSDVSFLTLITAVLNQLCLVPGKKNRTAGTTYQYFLKSSGTSSKGSPEREDWSPARLVSHQGFHCAGICISTDLQRGRLGELHSLSTELNPMPPTDTAVLVSMLLHRHLFSILVDNTLANFGRL